MRGVTGGHLVQVTKSDLFYRTVLVTIKIVLFILLLIYCQLRILNDRQHELVSLSLLDTAPPLHPNKYSTGVPHAVKRFLTPIVKHVDS